MIKKRKYSFEKVLGVNSFDLRNLRALRSKLDRDYLGFFEELSGLYQKSAQKKELQNTVVKIKQTIGLLNSILAGEAIGKRDVDKLISQINDINADKDYFLEKIPEVKAFSDRVNKVAAETGISPDDLNITEGIVKDVAKGTQKAQKEKIGSFLRRAMPGTLGLAGELAKGLGAAVAGPFTPILGPVAKDIFRAGKAITGKVRERREMGLGEQLRPVAAGVSPARAEMISGARGVSPSIGGFAGGVSRGRKASKEDIVRPLTYFFDKKAYRTKWTKELLSRIKNLGGRGKGGLLGGLLGGLKGLLMGVGVGAGVVGAAGAIGAGAAGAAAGAIPILLIEKKYAEWVKAMTDQYNAMERQIDVIIAYTTHLNKRMAETKEEWDKVNKVTKFLEEHKERKENISKYQISVKDLKRDPFATPKSSEIISTPESKNVSTLVKEKGEDRSKEELLDVMKNNEIQGQKLESAIKELSDSVKKEKEFPNIKGGGTGSPFDSADPLLADRAAGNLTIDEE